MKKLVWLGVAVLGLGGVWMAGRQAGSGGPASTGPSSSYDQFLGSSVPAGSVRPLQSRRLIGDSVSFGRIEGLALDGERMVVLDGLGPRAFNVIDLADGRTLTAVGRSGQGPGEFVAPRAVEVTRDGRAARAWVYDFQLGRLTGIDLSGESAEPQVLRVMNGLHNPAWIGDTLVTNGMFAGEMLRFYVPSDAEMDLVRSAGASPFSELQPDIAMHLNRSSMVVQPAGGRIAVAFLYISRLHLYDRHGRQTLAVAGPQEITPAYRTAYDNREGITRFLRTDETRFAYIDVTATDEAIYALYSGRARGEADGQEYAGNTIHVFDWDGRLVEVVQLPEDARRIMVDPSGERLYAARDLPWPGVIELNLK